MAAALQLCLLLLFNLGLAATASTWDTGGVADVPPLGIKLLVHNGVNGVSHMKSVYGLQV